MRAISIDKQFIPNDILKRYYSIANDTGNIEFHGPSSYALFKDIIAPQLSRYYNYTFDPEFILTNAYLNHLFLLKIVR